MIIFFMNMEYFLKLGSRTKKRKPDNIYQGFFVPNEEKEIWRGW